MAGEVIEQIEPHIAANRREGVGRGPAGEPPQQAVAADQDKQQDHRTPDLDVGRLADAEHVDEVLDRVLRADRAADGRKDGGENGQVAPKPTLDVVEQKTARAVGRVGGEHRPIGLRRGRGLRFSIRVGARRRRCVTNVRDIILIAIRRRFADNDVQREGAALCGPVAISRTAVSVTKLAHRFPLVLARWVIHRGDSELILSEIWFISVLFLCNANGFSVARAAICPCDNDFFASRFPSRATED